MINPIIPRMPAMDIRPHSDRVGTSLSILHWLSGAQSAPTTNSPPFGQGIFPPGFSELSKHSLPFEQQARPCVGIH